MSDLILVDEIEVGVTTITLNRPEKRNALNILMLEALCDAIEDVSARKDQRALAIRGAGPVFCAGLDLKEAGDPAISGRSAALVRRMLESVYHCPCVTIALIHGAALAGGAGLMAACDIALATKESKFGFPEVHRGLVAGLIMTFLRRQLHERHARELLLLGEIIDAERAKEMGLINRTVSADGLDEALGTIVVQVHKAPPGAIADTKAFFDQLWHHSLADDLDGAHDVHVKMRTSEEAQEGMAAFLEKRKPQWMP
ncbi:MAG: enoyl-CoA hydratase-related protein [Candidatus Hydrogenedentes bacterium]|nr:enoyl-CoA hydratase-related protein [Candidatus Hydrogenedentota bacterium]